MYNIYDNGRIPFKVKVDDKIIKIYKNNNGTCTSLAEITNYQKIFIGNDENFEGNSILVNVKYDEYIFIGGIIYSFKSISKINKYVSTMENRGIRYSYAEDIEENVCLDENWRVPSPYAEDIEGNVYLMENKVVIKNFDSKNYDDPYDYYYAHILITEDIGSKITKQPKIKNFMGISKFFIDEKRYTMYYEPYPEEEYESWKRFVGNKMYIVDLKGKKNEIVKSMYVEIMKRFGEINGFEPMKNIKVLIERN